MFRFIPLTFLIAVLCGVQTAKAETAVDAGAYLAARQAGNDRDFRAAAPFFETSVADDPDNRGLLESLAIVRLSLGDFEGALETANALDEQGYPTQTATMIRMADAAIREDWEFILSEQSLGKKIGTVEDVLIGGWAQLGQGNVAEAVQNFERVRHNLQFGALAGYHAALAYASFGDLDSARTLFEADNRRLAFVNDHAAIAYIQVLSQLDLNQSGVAFLDLRFGQNLSPKLAELRFRLAAGEPLPIAVASNPNDGIAESFYTMMAAFQGTADPSFELLYARIYEWLSGGSPDALIKTGKLLTALDQFDLAQEAYARVPESDLSFFEAELGRIETLRLSGETDSAISVAEELAASFNDHPLALLTLGNTLFLAEDFRAARDAFSAALDAQDEADPGRWYGFWRRGIAHFELDNWPAAEADFRAALASNPNAPEVLNYLGYSLVERRENLDEALAMIIRAVDLAPENGAIIDSLAWALFQLGRAEEAVSPMERAAQLLPLDPIVNDHLGDILWTVGRKVEARFQWQRALSLHPTDEEALKIREKLENGLPEGAEK